MKYYELLQEFKYVQNDPPDGIYLIPVPGSLFNSGISSAQTSPVKRRVMARPQNDSGLLGALEALSSNITPWQGVLFVRNAASVYRGAVIRFEIVFVRGKHILEWLPDPQTETANSSGPEMKQVISRAYFPVIHVETTVGSGSESYIETIAEFCLQGLVEAEQQHYSSLLAGPFSRVGYVLRRLVTWFDEADHDAEEAAKTVKESVSAEVLYQPASEKAQPEGSQLISFANLADSELSGIRAVVRQLAVPTVEEAGPT